MATLNGNGPTGLNDSHDAPSNDASLNNSPSNNGSAGPDRQLMLRGKPVEMPTLQLQLMSPGIVERRPPPPSGAGLSEYGQMLGRHKWLILGVTALFALVGGTVGLFQTPMYQARTALEVQGPNENFLNQKDMDPAASGGPSSLETYVETQARILQDDALLDKTLIKLNLDRKPELLNGAGPLAKVRRKLACQRLARHGKLRCGARCKTLRCMPRPKAISSNWRTTRPTRKPRRTWRMPWRMNSLSRTWTTAGKRGRELRSGFPTSWGT